MKKEEEIPQAVLKAASDFLKHEGGVVKYLGTKDGLKVYYAAIEDAETGFPNIYLYKGGEIILGLSGFEALKFSSRFFKD